MFVIRSWVGAGRSAAAAADHNMWPITLQVDTKKLD